jgi:hypothetical protein
MLNQQPRLILKLLPEDLNASSEKKKITEESAPANSPGSSSTFNNITSGNVIPKSRILAPVKWTFRSEQKSEGVYEVIAEAAIEEGWHIYGQEEQQELGPTPTTFLIEDNPAFIKEGQAFGTKQWQNGRAMMNISILTW